MIVLLIVVIALIVLAVGFVLGCGMHRLAMEDEVLKLREERDVFEVERVGLEAQKRMIATTGDALLAIRQGRQPWADFR